MKKKFKKLSLTTETLRNLSDSGLKKVAGATAAETDCDCTVPGSECTVMCSACTIQCTWCGIHCSAPCN
ncbi:MAG TPA: hypothetical protein VLV54_01555 [Thermoanaerobaculia bacterium]|nr:hypothetical protein [Thermoanaerobaculia bacterium]